MPDSNLASFRNCQDINALLEAIKDKLRTIDVNRLTPIEALLKLNELLKMLE